MKKMNYNWKNGTCVQRGHAGENFLALNGKYIITADGIKNITLWNRLTLESEKEDVI